ncbi:MAG: hypothetical protein ACK4SX_09395 [Alcanivoracaceae bacterium]
MSDQRKPPGGKTPPKALLDELSSIQALLGDGDRDVAPASLLDDDVPLLDPVPPLAGDADSQIPLLDESGPATASSPLSKALAARDNPFLPRKPGPAAPSATPKIEPARPAAPAPSRSSPVALNDAAARALVDEVLAEWMPKIERDLRNRLMDLLKKPS